MTLSLPDPNVGKRIRTWILNSPGNSQFLSSPMAISVWEADRVAQMEGVQRKYF